jgi:hypothetical protein
VAGGLRIANYSVTPINGTLTITPAALVVVPTNLMRDYGAANPALTANVTGALNGDIFTASGYTTATTNSPVAVYPITYTVGGPNLTNYAVTASNGMLTVTRATSALTWATPPSIVYGTVLSATQLNASSSTAGTFSYTPSIGTVLAASTQALSVTFTPDDPTDYTAPSASVSLIVNKAPLTITAASMARTFGTPNPVFTGTVTGSVNGDTFTEMFSTPATPTSIVGLYPIVPSVSSSSLANYTVAPINGSLTVSQAGTSTTFALSNLNTTFTANVASLAGGSPSGNVAFYEGQTVVGSGTLSNGIATYTGAALPVGDVVLSAQYSGDANFTQSASPPILILSVTPGFTSLTVPRSGSVTDSINLSTPPGYSGTVQLSCTGLPALATCSFQPSSIVFNGTSTTATAVMTIQTGVSAGAQLPLSPGESRSITALAALFWMPGLMIAAICKRKGAGRSSLQRLSILLLLFGFSIGAMGCGNSPSPAVSMTTPVGSTTFQVVATGPQGLSQTTGISVNVQ